MLSYGYQYLRKKVVFKCNKYLIHSGNIGLTLKCASNFIGSIPVISLTALLTGVNSPAAIAR
jgi:hypothetical protein